MKDIMFLKHKRKGNNIRLGRNGQLQQFYPRLAVLDIPCTHILKVVITNSQFCIAPSLPQPLIHKSKP